MSDGATTFFGQASQQANAGELNFDPGAASRVMASCYRALGAFIGLQEFTAQLQNVQGCGTFPSGIQIAGELGKMGAAFDQSLTAMQSTVREMADAVRAAGKATQQTDQDSAVNLDNVKPGGRYSTDATECTVPDFRKNSKEFFGGMMSSSAKPESPYSYDLAGIHGHCSDIDSGNLRRTAHTWFDLSVGMSQVLEQFMRDVGKDLGAEGSWSGVGAEAMKSGISQFIDSGNHMSVEANQAGNTVMRLAEQLDAFKSKVPPEATGHDVVLATAPFSPTAAYSPGLPAQVQMENNRRTQIAREAMSALYVPGITDTGSSMPKPTQPYNPVVAMPTPATSGSSGGGGGVGGAATFSGGGGSGGGSAAAMALRNGGDASAAAKAAEDAGTLGPSSPSSGLPEAASAPAQVVDGLSQSASGGGGPESGPSQGGFGDADTEGMSPTELAAMRAAGMAAGSPTTAGAGGTAGGAGLKGVGGLGGAGLGGAGSLSGAGGALSAKELSAEAKLSQRAAAAETLAAREAAAARATASAGQTGQSGAPIASRAGSAASSGDKNKDHKSSKLLQWVKNGEEIIGPDTTSAPEVIDANHGPLNLSYDNDR